MGELQKAYKTVMDDHFAPMMEISFVGEDGKRQTLFYEKKTWVIDGVKKGLRYGENPGQEAALYKLVNGNLALGDVQTIQPGRHLASDVELLQSGKHPGKTNITDTDNALNIIRYFGSDEPVVAILKHNNPCGIALGSDLLESYLRAYRADQVAAFGGAIALNGALDRETAEAIVDQYCEVVAAPEFEEGVMEILKRRKNLRVMKISNMDKLQQWSGERVVDFKSLMDGGIITQTSFVPQARSLEDFKALKLGYGRYKGIDYQVEKAPTEEQWKDLRFGWLVESGITSNSVIYVKDLVTVGIGTGEQDRVGVAKIAKDKAYIKAKDRICWDMFNMPHNDLFLEFEKAEGSEKTELADKLGEIEEAALITNARLQGARMVSDAFFPNRDGADVGLREGIDAIIQPGGSERDFETIEAVNEVGATMVYTGQRSFKH
ncbi:MAG: IMP cyclohydrolase [Nanoarchaeota archaeon]|nr:IMP cyclohydrolase [Nanoarchaeota archaeon]